MRWLWFCVLVHCVIAQYDFGKSYLSNSKLCHPWACINTKLGLPDALPPQEQYIAALKSLLPPGAWQESADRAITHCYTHRGRNYVNTCPGQALLHCVVDNLIQFCPDESLRKEDACAPVSSLAGFKYMFSQSRYENLERNLPLERRPSWFLKNYFGSKCCNLPEMFNSTVMNECGFNSVMHYYNHAPQPHEGAKIAPATEEHKLPVINLELLEENTKPNGIENKVELSPVLQDPLDCCELDNFVQPSWRSECEFHLTWDPQTRLTLPVDESVTTKPTTTTTAPTVSPIRSNDVKVAPLSCEKENCIFKKLNIVSETGEVDKAAFTKLLEKMKNTHKSWSKATARAVTRCLSRPVHDYEAECKINAILQCVLDSLSENCPHAKKKDPCSHSISIKNDTVCQISGSKYRIKYRRLFCGLPPLVPHEVLSECGASTLTQLEYVPRPAVSKLNQRWTAFHMCNKTTPATTCVMKKMDILNKYGFTDYFKMKDRIRSFSQNEWSLLRDVYLSTFSSTPIYKEHCNTQRQLLNVFDAFLMTCPLNKRKTTPQCVKIFEDLRNNIPKTESINYYNHIFLPIPKVKKINERSVKKPLYNFGVLESDSVPRVEIIDVKSAKTTQPPRSNLELYPMHSDGVFRSGPFLHNFKLTQARLNRVL